MTDYLFIKKYGKGVPIIWIHGFMESSKTWQRVLNNLKDDYNNIVLNLPGHGKTSYPKDKLDMKYVINWILSILKKEKILKAILVGHSMGGYISLAMAENHPNIVLGVILVNSHSLEDSQEKKENRIKAIQLVDKGFPYFVSSSVPKLFSNKAVLNKEEIIKETITESLSMSCESVKAYLKLMLKRKDQTPILMKNFPKLLIYGLEDLSLSNKSLQTMKSNSLNMKFIGLNTSHMAQLELPSEVADIIEVFVRQKFNLEASTTH